MSLNGSFGSSEEKGWGRKWHWKEVPSVGSQYILIGLPQSLWES
jgi:hypothetical protein